MKIAVYPGSFDPVTMGHLDIIHRAAPMFDKFIVAVMMNSSKKYVFNAEKRKEFIQRSIVGIPNVEVVACNELLADFTKKCNASVIVKGLRAVSDFEYEFQMALINKRLNPDVETIFLTTSPDYMFLSSSVVKEVGSYGADVHSLLPPQIEDEVMKAIKR